MITIQFEVENQLLKRTDSETIVSKSRNIIQAQFTVKGDIWNDVDLFVIFTDAWDDKTTVHLNNGTCIVPGNCLDSNFFKITVYGGDRITTNNVIIPLIDSGYDPHHSIHHSCNKNSKDIFVEIFEKMHIKIDDVLYADNCIHFFSDKRLVNSVSLPFIDESSVMSLIAGQLERYMKTEDLEDYLKERGYVNHVLLDGDELIFE